MAKKSKAKPSNDLQRYYPEIADMVGKIAKPIHAVNDVAVLVFQFSASLGDIAKISAGLSEKQMELFRKAARVPENAEVIKDDDFVTFLWPDRGAGLTDFDVYLSGNYTLSSLDGVLGEGEPTKVFVNGNEPDRGQSVLPGNIVVYIDRDEDDISGRFENMPTVEVYEGVLSGRFYHPAMEGKYLTEIAKDELLATFLELGYGDCRLFNEEETVDNNYVLSDYLLPLGDGQGGLDNVRVVRQFEQLFTFQAATLAEDIQGSSLDDWLEFVIGEESHLTAESAIPETICLIEVNGETAFEICGEDLGGDDTIKVVVNTDYKS